MTVGYVEHDHGDQGNLLNPGRQVDGSLLAQHLRNTHGLSDDFLDADYDWQSTHRRLHDGTRVQGRPRPDAKVPEGHIMLWHRLYLTCGSAIAYRADEYGARPSNARLQEVALKHFNDVHGGDLDTRDVCPAVAPRPILASEVVTYEEMARRTVLRAHPPARAADAKAGTASGRQGNTDTYLVSTVGELRQLLGHVPDDCLVTAQAEAGQVSVNRVGIMVHTYETGAKQLVIDLDT